MDSDTSIDVSFDDNISTKSKSKASKEPSTSDAHKLQAYKSSDKKSSLVMPVSPKANSKKRKGNKGKESGTSSEEERWLDAIESGKLEEVKRNLCLVKFYHSHSKSMS